jgi:hypothetical protein
MAESAQQQLRKKLAVCRQDGQRIHGNLIETYKTESEVVIRVINPKCFFCLCWVCIARCDSH